MYRISILVTFLIVSTCGQIIWDGAWAQNVHAFPCIENVRFSIFCKPSNSPTVTRWELLYRYARKITVRVLFFDKAVRSGDNIRQAGSGVIIRQDRDLYTVLTNEHVVGSDSKYLIETFDRKVYPAAVYRAIKFTGNDLALVQFRSVSTYPVAALGKAYELNDGEDIFAAGFALDAFGEFTEPFQFRGGQVGIKTNRPLEDGYQLGYTSDVRNGMSGGPVLNSRGQVVAVNGLQSQPLIDDAYIFQNGVVPCAPMVDMMRDFAFGIPMETFMALAAKSLSLGYSLPQQQFEPEILATTLVKKSEFNLKDRMTPFQTLLMQLKVATAKQCLPLTKLPF